MQAVESMPQKRMDVVTVLNNMPTNARCAVKVTLTPPLHITTASTQKVDARRLGLGEAVPDDQRSD